MNDFRNYVGNNSRDECICAHPVWQVVSECRRASMANSTTRRNTDRRDSRCVAAYRTSRDIGSTRRLMTVSHLDAARDRETNQCGSNQDTGRRTGAAAPPTTTNCGGLALAGRRDNHLGTHEQAIHHSARCIRLIECVDGDTGLLGDSDGRIVGLHRVGAPLTTGR